MSLVPPPRADEQRRKDDVGENCSVGGRLQEEPFLLRNSGYGGEYSETSAQRKEAIQQRRAHAAHTRHPHRSAQPNPTNPCSPRHPTCARPRRRHARTSLRTAGNLHLCLSGGHSARSRKETALPLLNSGYKALYCTKVYGYTFAIRTKCQRADPREGPRDQTGCEGRRSYGRKEERV